MLDLAIEDGTVHDGSGAPGRLADVGVSGGRITEIAEPGHLSPATRTVDARGRIVTPGFIDPHTHMDAQLWWEPSGAPSVLHGVTTIVIGSCGFGIAPFAAGHAEYVLRSLESVEEIPYRVTRDALPMSWKGWADYYEQLGGLPLGLNVAGFVPHSALRVGVLGDAGRAATLDAGALDRLRAELREALAAGAVGFSTSRGGNHTDANGDPVPSRLASDDELLALVGECEGRIWQINIAAKGDTSDAGVQRAMAELDSYSEWALRTGTRATWTPLVVAPGDRHAWRRLAEYSAERSPQLVPQVSAQAVQSAIHFQGPSFAGMIDGWARAFASFSDLDAAGRLERVGSPEFRAILKAAPEDCDRITAPCFDRWIVGASPSRADAVGWTVAEYAHDVGAHPIDAILDLALADDLRTVIEAPLSNLDPEAVRELITSPTTLIGLGDAGAHITSISNYTYPTFVLGDLAAKRGWMPIADAVHRMTAQPAAVMGLRDRGTLTPGARADVCVIDLDRLAVGVAELVDDLPGGGQRLNCSATGYDAVIVNGVVTVERDRLTGGRAGELARGRHMSDSESATGAHTAIEKILARASGRSSVRPGETVVCEIDRVVLIDMQFRSFNGWRRPVRIADPSRVAVILDHAVPAPSVADANAAVEARAFVEQFGIDCFIDVGAHGICHQVIAERGLARPGEMLVSADSHTCAAGAFGTAARGLGATEVLQVLCTGATWVVVPETLRIGLHGALDDMVSGKDLFLHLAGSHGGAAENRALEFVGDGIATLPFNDRRTIATQAAELVADYALFPCDDVTRDVLARAGVEATGAVTGDDDAVYAGRVDVELGAVAPMVGLPDHVVDNTVPVATAAGERIDQCFIGSCANGQIEDLEIAAAVVKGRRVAAGTRMIVTPGSQQVYLEAVRRGYVETLVDAGAVVTSSACGACFGYDFGVMGDGEVCLTASTRNFRGRMGSPTARIFMASPATVAASALTGVITDPREAAPTGSARPEGAPR